MSDPIIVDLQARPFAHLSMESTLLELQRPPDIQRQAQMSRFQQVTLSQKLRLMPGNTIIVFTMTSGGNDSMSPTAST